MAFNPFEAFSIRSRLGKSLMAILGIVIMLTFVLSSGAVGTGNDFFDQIGGIFNSGRKGDVVATAYGDKVHQADLTEIRRQRLAARAFLLQAREAGFINWTKELGEVALGTQLTLDVRKYVAAFAEARPSRFAAGLEGNKYRMITRNPEPLRNLLRDSKPDSEDRRALSAVVAIIYHDEQGAGLAPVLPDREFNPETDDGALNFLLLLKKADRFGIKYSEKAVIDLVGQETGGRLTKEDGGAIEANLRRNQQYGTFTGEWLMDAVGNEFRARAALAALQGLTLSDAARADSNRLVRGLGGEPPGRGTAAAVLGGLTPYEFFEFYKDNCSEHTFDAIEVPAAAFLPQVTGQPTPKERIDLFNRYRADLPDPARDRPAFKEPRKVKVEYVTLDATAKRITDAQPKVAAANLFLAASAGPMTFGGTGIPGVFQATHPTLAATLPYQEAVRAKVDANMARYMGADQYAFEPRDALVYRPQPIAALLAGFAGYPSPAAASLALTVASRYIEQDYMKHRVPFFLQGWLAPFNPVATNALGLPTSALYLPKPPPEALYAAAVAADQKKAERRRLFDADVAQFTAKVSELARDPQQFAALSGGRKDDKDGNEKLAKGRAEARKYIAEWLAERGLTAHGTAAPRTAMELTKDPALKPLNDAAVPEADGTNSFAQQVFATFDLSGQLGRPIPPIEQMSPFQTGWFPRKPEGEDMDKPAHLFWMTANYPAVQYPSLKVANETLAQEGFSSWDGMLFGFDADRMTERVDKAWRLDKARALAKAEADKLAEKVKEIGKRAAANPAGVEKEMRDLVAAQGYRVIVLDGIAKLKFQHAATQAQTNYGPPAIDKTKVLYPPGDFADKLLEVRNQPPGAVTVVADAPRTNYYVACLVSTTPKTVEQFRDVFGKANATGPALNPLYISYALQDEQREADRTVVARLRAEAGVPMDAIKKEEGAAE